MEGTDQAVRGEPVERAPHRAAPRAVSRVPLACALAALVLLVGAVRQMDRPTLEVVRALRAVAIERVGDAGDLLGKGWTLLALSGLFVAVGYWRADSTWRAAGVQGWIAHAVTGILVQGLKHSLGRPRPRLHQEDTFVTGPTLEAGYDSFPSGHAAASFAVAAVLATHFPRWARPAYALAGFVALTRIFRGAHFVSDVVAGIGLGLVVGTLVVAPRHQWRIRVQACVVPAVSWLVAGGALLWLLVWPASDLRTAGLLLGAGVLTGLSHWTARGARSEAVR